MALTAVATVVESFRSIEVNVGGVASREIRVWRVTPWSQAEARMATAVESTESRIGYDYEAPPDVDVQYKAEALDGTGAVVETIYSNKVRLPSNGHDWWVSMGTPSLTRTVTIESFTSLQRALGHTLVQPLTGKYPIPTIAGRRSAIGSLVLLTLTLDEAASLRGLIENAPLFLLNGPPDEGLEDGLYLLAGNYSEERTSRWAHEPSRRFTIEVVEVARPPLEMPIPDQNTWGEWKTEGAPNGTWAGWRQRSYLDLLNEAGIP